MYKRAALENNWLFHLLSCVKYQTSGKQTSFKGSFLNKKLVNTNQEKDDIKK